MSTQRTLIEIEKEIDVLRELLNQIAIDIDTKNVNRKNQILYVSEQMDNLILEYFNISIKA